MLSLNRIALIGALVLIASCGGGGGGSIDPASPTSNPVSVVGTTDSVSANVGAAGGTLKTSNDSLRLDLPNGSLASPTSISVTPASVVAPQGTVGATTVELGPTGQTFQKSVTLTLKYDATLLPDGVSETSLTVATLNGGAWVDVPTTVDVQNKLLTASLSHFSTYSVKVSDPSKAPYGTLLGDVNGVSIYSNGCLDPSIASCGSHPDTYNTGNLAGYNSGLQWQCVELVNRYYYQVYNQDIRIPGQNANQYFKNAAERGLTAYLNGGNTQPAVGDILVSEGGVNGHVAIVREVTATIVKVAEQNWHEGPADVSTPLALHISSGKYTISGFGTSYPVVGWLRTSKPANLIKQVGIASVETYNGKAQLQWGKDTSYSYTLYYAAAPDITPANYLSKPQGTKLVSVSSPLVLSGLTNGTTYTFVLVASKGQYNSAPSASISGTPNPVGTNWNTLFKTSRYMGSPISAFDGSLYIPSTGAILSSMDGSNWAASLVGTNLTSNPADDQYGTAGSISRIARGNSRIVAVGASGAILAGPDLDHLVLKSSGVGSKLYWVTFGGGRFVAVGSKGAITTSLDGETWTVAQSGVSSTIRSVEYLTGKFFAVGDSGIIGSVDGSTWQSVYSSTGNTLSEIVYGDGKYVAVGWGILLNSSDGIAWNAVGGLTNQFSTVAYGNGRFVAASLYGNAFTSVDGSSWSPVVFAPQPNCATCTNQAVGSAFYGGKFYVQLLNNYIQTSVDGTSWSIVSIFPIARPNATGTLYAGGKYLVWGQDGLILLSTDAATWISISLPAADSLTTVVWGSGVFLGTGTGSALYSSVDGIHWSIVSIPGAVQSHSVAFSAGKFFVFGAAGANYSSLDGRNWNSVATTGISGALTAIVSDGLNMVASDQAGKVVWSSDGASWTTAIPTVGVYRVLYSMGMFVAFNSQTSDVYSSVDGKSWQKQNLYTGSTSVFGFGAANGRFYLNILQSGLRSTNIWTSIDGRTWSDMTTSALSPFYSYSSTNGASIVAIDADGSLWYSR